MDIKIKGLTLKLLTQALDQAKAGRMHIMGKMMAAISEPRTQLSAYAPKIKQLTIPGNKIGELIGPGGKMIKSIIEETGAEIDVDENEDGTLGLINISSPDQEKIDAAVNIIETMFKEINIGDEFDGLVNRVEAYGAFVELTPNKDGLVHVSAMATKFVGHAEEVVKVGDKVHVHGRISDPKDSRERKQKSFFPDSQEAPIIQRKEG